MWLFLKNLSFAILVPGMVAVVIPVVFIIDDASLPDRWTLRQLAALPLILVGLAVFLRSIWSFGVSGKGTPAPIDPPRTLVVTGLYRYVRNPMYVAVLAVILGEALFFASWRVALYGAVVAFIFQFFVVLIEEPSLERQFGDSYRRYRAGVRRWLPGRPYRSDS